MKIVNSITKIYTEKINQSEKLKEEVDKIIIESKKKSWHYFSRIKSIESFALKLETGRFKISTELDDFFACTLVVENLTEINSAITTLAKDFDIHHKRPKDEKQTHKEAFSFPFDDLRLYVCLKKVDYLPENLLSNIFFEIQIKTFLQHAWVIATHDLIYKSNTINWAKERVAYQIKAILEQAELSISGVEELSRLNEISKENTSSRELNEIIDFLSNTFSAEALPKDLVRLSRTIKNTLLFFRISTADLSEILDSETKEKKGILTLNLSPYGIIIQSIINQRRNIFEEGFKRKNNKKVEGFFIPSEIDLNGLQVENIEKIIRT